MASASGRTQGRFRSPRNSRGGACADPAAAGFQVARAGDHRDMRIAIPVIARARDLEACGGLIRAGATRAYPEAIESSLRLGAEALAMLGISTEEVDSLLRGVRNQNYAQVVE